MNKYFLLFVLLAGCSSEAPDKYKGLIPSGTAALLLNAPHCENDIGNVLWFSTIVVDDSCGGGREMYIDTLYGTKIDH